MTEQAAPTKKQIDEFVAAWFRALDLHVPIEEAAAFLADRDLHLQFPESDMRDFASFKQWYDRLVSRFFDENHDVQSVQAKISGDQAALDIVVGWQASWWEPPAARSQRVSLVATQRWTVRRSTKNRHGLEIVTYNATAEPFKYAPGSAWL